MRALLWGVPEILRTILTDEFKQEAGVELIVPSVAENLSRAIERHEPDIIVTNVADDELDYVCKRFILVQTHRRVLAVREDGRSVNLYRLRWECVSLEETSPERIANVIREPRLN